MHGRKRKGCCRHNANGAGRQRREDTRCETVPALLQALSDGEWKVRSAAADALGALGARDAEGHLPETLSDVHGTVRWAALRSLRQLGRQLPGPHLARAQEGPDLFVRNEARLWQGNEE